jgi:hypothetical protein
LNPRPSPWQGDALPLSYSRLVLTKYIGRPEQNQRLHGCRGVRLRVTSDSLATPLSIAATDAHPLPLMRGDGAVPFLDARNLAVPHMHDAISDGRSFGIVRDHQHGLPKLFI